MNSCLNRNSISVFSVSQQRKQHGGISLSLVLLLLLSSSQFLLAIQNSKLKMGYLLYKSEIFVIFFQRYTIIPVTSSPYGFFFHLLASFGVSFRCWGFFAILSIQFWTNYYMQKSLWIICPFLVLRNDLWKNQHSKSMLFAFAQHTVISKNIVS